MWQKLLERLVSFGWRKSAIVVVIVLALGYFFFGRSASTGASIVVTPGDFAEQVSVAGTVVATKDADLGFAASGRIAGVYAAVGEYVGAGTIIAETENGDLASQVAQARADLASLQAGARPEQVAVAQASVASATSALVNAIGTAYTAADDAVHNKADSLFTNPRTTPKLSFNIANATLQSAAERDRAGTEPVLAALALQVAGLSASNAATTAAAATTALAQIASLLADANAALNQALPDQTTTAATLTTYTASIAAARTSVNSAATALTAAAAALDSAQKNLVLTQAGPTADAVAAAEALVRAASAALGKTRVVAPFAGVVTRMDAKVGEIVSPTTSQISMQSDGVFEVETYVPEVSISRIAVGNPATTTLDAYGSSVPFAASVISVDPAETVKDGVPTYKTTLSFAATDPRIRSGMTANVVIETGLLHDAIVIPAGAIGADVNGPYVSLLAKGAVEKRRVLTGVAPALGQALVESGLASGDVLLLTPAP